MTGWPDPLDANRDRRRTIARDQRWLKIGNLVEEELTLDQGFGIPEHRVITSDGDVLQSAGDLLRWLREQVSR